MKKDAACKEKLLSYKYRKLEMGICMLEALPYYNENEAATVYNRN